MMGRENTLRSVDVWQLGQVRLRLRLRLRLWGEMKLLGKEKREVGGVKGREKMHYYYWRREGIGGKN